MEWTDIASVELPAGMQSGDVRGVIEQLEMQVKAVLGKGATDDIPRVKSLAPVVKRAFDRMVARRDELSAREAQRKPSPESASGERQDTANTTADDAWRAIEHALKGATYLTDGKAPGRAEASKLHAEVFGEDGLRFINYRPRRQWDASVKHLAAITTDEAVTVLNAIGAERHLAALRVAHEAFGKAFGFRAHTTAQDEAVTSTRAEQLAAQAALREYVFKVSAQADEEDPESVRLTRFLLAPYIELVEDLARAPRKAPKTPAAPTTPTKPE